MEQASNDPFSMKYNKYNLHDNKKLGKLCAFFPLCTIIVLCTIKLVYLDFATLYYYFALYYYLELKSKQLASKEVNIFFKVLPEVFD